MSHYHIIINALLDTLCLLKIAFHDRKEEKNDINLKKVNKEHKPKPKPKEEPAHEPSDEVINKKFEVKVQKIEENICQWIDEETKTIKETVEKDIASIRTEVDTKNIEMNSKVQGSIHDLKQELNTKVAEIDEKLNNMEFTQD